MKPITIALAAFAVVLAAQPARAQHSVNLTWTASTDAAANPSLAYNIYRSPTCGGSFAKLNGSPIAVQAYSDRGMVPGSYCYQVTSVLNGSESAPSNQAAALIPAPVQQQTRCAHRGKLFDWLRCVAESPKSAKVAPARRQPSRQQFKFRP